MAGRGCFGAPRRPNLDSGGRNRHLATGLKDAGPTSARRPFSPALRALAAACSDTGRVVPSAPLRLAGLQPAKRASGAINTRKTAVTTMSEHQSTVAPAGVSEPDGTSGASLEKVRDLLFGVQMRDYDRKFARLEERLIQETSDLREEVKKRLATIDQFV